MAFFIGLAHVGHIAQSGFTALFTCQVYFYLGDGL